MNDRSILLKQNQNNRPTALDFAKAIYKTIVICQKLINANIELINSGEGDIERNKIFLEAKESSFYLLMNNLLIDFNKYIHSVPDKDVENIINDEESFELVQNFLDSHKRFMRKHQEIIDATKTK